MYDYFGIQGKIGLTKHTGGLKATKYLLEHCNVDSSKYVLIAGSGNGISTINIAKLTGCRAVGIDISEDMVKSANEKSRDKTEFKLGDAENIPFPDNTFDAVISESVTAFTDKEKSLSEYRRVLKKKGYLGLNEVTWLGKPATETADYAFKVMAGLKPETKQGWLSLLKKKQFRQVTGESYKMKKFEQLIGELQMQGFNAFKIWGRFFYFYFAEREFRRSVHKMAKDALKIPKGFMNYFGYGLYTARK
ncbi:class I SAM-dependent methyltransferase [Candidatus Woesearchaeota archaeon]|nr:class I SAM-dependent methyltransferase [Candidatus Woesearchaeota archaeon]